MKYNQVLYPFESKWIEINNESIHYVDEGNGQVILFSHAAVGSSFMYRKIMMTLSKHFRCIALDFPGFGLSLSPSRKSFSIAEQADILRSFINKMELTDIIGLGHDTGGPSVCHVAVRNPELFRGLILTDTVPFPIDEYKKIHRMLGIVGSRPFRWLNNCTNLLIRLTVNKGVVTRKLKKEEKEEYYRMTSLRSRRSNMTQVLYSLRQHPRFMNEIKNGLENQLNQKHVLLIYGENDPVQLLGIPDRIHDMLSNSELFLIKGEAHFPHEGQPDRMAEIIFHWIRKRICNQASLQVW